MSGGAQGGPDPTALDRAPLVLGQAAPNAGVLVAVECPAQAGFDRLAAAANGLGLVDLQQGRAGGAYWEEQLRIFVTAGGSVSPVHALRPSVGARRGVATSCSFTP